MNLLQALQTLSSKPPQDGNLNNGGAADETPPPAPAKPPAQDMPRPNVMANVLERHEAIANRLRNKK